MKKQLFSDFCLRSISFKNRIFLSPMCQYSSVNGMSTDWHLVHLGSRAVGGASLVMVEATAVSPEGRISPSDLGIWTDAHVDGLACIAKFIKDQGAVPAIQLAHAGRKASMPAPWDDRRCVLNSTEGGWETLAPSALAFDKNYSIPRAMKLDDIAKVTQDFKQAVSRSLEAGFQVVELHMAHGYLFHEFLSPLSNYRIDLYGGEWMNRIRFSMEIVEATRALWPEKYPFFVRLSATDWVDGGWDLTQSIQLSQKLKELGVDLIDCSSGGLIPDVKIPIGPGYQVHFAEEIRTKAGIATGAVGMITNPQQAEKIIAQGQADVVFLARELLRRPYWPLHAAHALGVDVAWPKQYERGKLC